MQTTWGQGCGYNNLLASESQMGCPELPCDRAFTGCVATAMAQIMRYHQYPSNYSWSIMPNDVSISDQYSTGTNEIARLMKNVGTSVFMDYNCDGFRKNKICHENGATSYLFFHMNWGWDNLFDSGLYEGWYGFLDFTPDDDTFNYKSGVIIGIRP